MSASSKPTTRPMRDYAYRGGPPDYVDMTSPLQRLFWSNEGPVVHKWHHYLPIYERYFERFRSKSFRMLEIGVFKGGSLKMWRDYFGEKAQIFGIDINPECARFDGQSAQVRIGSQADPDFLNDVIDEMGGVDVVLDDGSHDSHHIRETLSVVYPRLSVGGVYMIEDLHAAYWPKFSGGYHATSSFMNDVKSIIDDIHHWYHDEGQVNAATSGAVSSLHVYDSIVVLEKETVRPPRHTKVGGDNDA